MMMKFVILSAVTLALISVVFASDSENNVFRPISIAGSKDVLSKVEMIPLKLDAFGAESIAFDPNGEGPYTGVADGRILKWMQHDQTWVDFAVTSSQREHCSQAFAPEMEHLLDIDDHDHVIYFTDSSTIYQRSQFVAATASGDKTGRLMKYDTSTKLLEGLSFANGVALSKDKTFVLVAETSACRILRYWLKGPNVGTHDTFAQLPGFPDNVRTNSRGEFWVALHSKASPLARLLTSNSRLGKTLLSKCTTTC
ncbi:hypothetical protein BC332_12360 [Capsicum chinense]|nr:hypothetical protein BC332_12360 [Capsicum chinense]